MARELTGRVAMAYADGELRAPRDSSPSLRCCNDVLKSYNRCGKKVQPTTIDAGTSYSHNKMLHPMLHKASTGVEKNLQQ